ncbi:MAG: efflux RND transporter permease subunit [bacterium]
MRNFFKFFIEHPKLVNLFLVLVLVAGSLSFFNLKRDSIPNVDFKMMFVATIYPGAAPEDVEINVTIPIEEELQKISGISAMDSFSAENFSTVFVEIDPYASDIEEVKRDVYKAVDRVSNLPAEVTSKPLVTELKSEIFPVFEVGINGDSNISELELRQHAEVLEKKLQLLPGVAGTKKVGYRKREIHIEVDPVKAANNYLSIGQVMNAIRATNIRLSGGTIQSLAAKKKVIALSQFVDPLEVKNVIVRSAFSGQRVLVSDLAEVTDSFEDRTRISKVNGIPSINIVVEKKVNADAVKVAGDVRQLLTEFNKTLPNGVNSQIVKDYSVYVKSMLSVVVSNAIVGFLLVVLCLMIFLDRKVAFWTALGIPFSLLVSFFFMPHYDIAVTTQSLLAFIIVLGMLVDDAIVVAEHIYAFREKGMAPVEAAVKGISEIFWPVCATVFTTIAAFLPVLLMGGIWGDFIKAIPIVITITLLASLFESAFILPGHLAITKIRQKGKSNVLIFFEKHYRERLIWVLKRKNRVIGFFVIIFFLAVGVILPRLGFELFPTSDADMIMVKITTPLGTPLWETEKRVTQLEEIIKEIVPPNILVSYVTTIGERGTDMWDSISGMTQDHWARVNINLTPAQSRKVSSFKIRQQLEDKFAPLKASKLFADLDVVTQAGGPPTGKAVDISFIGNDDKVRTELGDELWAMLSTNEAAFDLYRNDETGLQELNIRLDHGLMNDLGITAVEVATTIRAAIAGTIVTSIRKEGEEIDFRVMLAERYRNNANYLNDLTISNRQGKLIPLGSFIRFEDKAAPLGISHSSGDRVLRINAELDRSKINPMEYNKQLQKKFNALTAQHPGFRLEFNGLEKYTTDSLNDFFRSMLLALLVIYIILVVLFNSFTEPAIVMLAIPFGLVGVIFAFLIHGESLSFLALIGILGLAGVVVNNSLVMLKFLNTKEENTCEAGETLTIEHIAEAAVLRFRPIVLTTITTVAGLLPSLYGLFGGRVDFLFPLLLALSWGLVFSTGITLFLIPAFFLVERNVTCWIRGKLTAKQQS